MIFYSSPCSLTFATDLVLYFQLLLNRITVVEVCDATKADSSTVAKYIIIEMIKRESGENPELSP